MIFCVFFVGFTCKYTLFAYFINIDRNKEPNQVKPTKDAKMENIIKATFRFNGQKESVCATNINQIRLIIQNMLNCWDFIPFSENRKEYYYVGPKRKKVIVTYHNI